MIATGTDRCGVSCNSWALPVCCAPRKTMRNNRPSDSISAINRTANTLTLSSLRPLWNVESIHSMCRLDQILRSAELLPNICQQPASSSSSSSSTSQCCPSWTLGHYVALMRNRSSCFDIDESDVNAVFKILEVCSKHYHGLRLSANCDTIVQEGKTGHIKAVPSNIYIDFDTLVN